jgi:parallel beta-helix repeat protein
MNRLSFPATILPASILLAAAAFLTAGPLNPPAGPVASTYRTLTEVEPRIPINSVNTPASATGTFTITQPGSYYLTGNTTGATGKNGIEILSDNVTIDLRGFDLIGGVGGLDGIATTSGSPAGVTIMNGTISGWTGDGIDLLTTFSPSCHICDIQSTGNGGVGIKAGNGFTIDRCTARLNGGGGISAQNLGIVRSCTTVSNSTVGLLVGQGSAISGCLSGFNLGTVDAIRTGGYCSVQNCTVDTSNGNGLVVGPISSVTGCAVDGANLAGISAGTGCTIAHCSVDFAQTINIVVGNGSTVTECSVQFGNLGGIECSNQCVIRNNTCMQNANGSATGFNIHATGADNRIESNNCTQAGRGIKVDSAGNFITRNTCSGNSTNYDIVAGNVALVVSAAATPAAILGSAGGVAPGSTDPSVNFSF